ncbi:hypothetical protein ARMGADRAFT_1084772 [Armillaria gallica]|uniref:Metallo-beta-lactamase domain-containing protein n=1 Tax=Armillaria gallica TaxID=47427 RepID=A0A2H3D228_ARMGA|nr:hypothetical protein ARMGADRAFT_1084772 [Armillaria gallica]
MLSTADIRVADEDKKVEAGRPDISQAITKYTEPPCKIEGISELNAVIISHNHSDHLDYDTLTTLFKMTYPPHVSGPLGSDKHDESIGKPKGHACTFEWWDARHVEIPGTSFELSCAPAQHFTGRWMLDQRKFSRSAGPARLRSGLVRPVFAEIRQWLSGCGLAMIPIRIYQPRWFMSVIHCARHDAYLQGYQSEEGGRDTLIELDPNEGRLV